MVLKNRVTTDISDTEYEMLKKAINDDKRTLASALRRGISLYLQEVLEK